MGVKRPSRLIVGITGASGAVYGVRLLERARALEALQGAASKPLFSTRCFKQTGALIAEAA